MHAYFFIPTYTLANTHRPNGKHTHTPTHTQFHTHRPNGTHAHMQIVWAVTFLEAKAFKKFEDFDNSCIIF